MDVWMDRWMGRYQIWAGFPPNCSVIIWNIFVCNRRVVGFDLNLRCLRWVMSCFNEGWVRYRLVWSGFKLGQGFRIIVVQWLGITSSVTGAWQDLILFSAVFVIWRGKVVRLVVSSWIVLMMSVLVLYLRDVDAFNVIQWWHWCWVGGQFAPSRTEIRYVSAIWRGEVAKLVGFLLLCL